MLEGWTSPSLVLLQSDETPLASGKITSEEASWIASLLHVGALIGSVFFGYITNHFGRKLPLLIIAIPMIVITIFEATKFSYFRQPSLKIFLDFFSIQKISWLLIWFGENVYYYYVARILGGFFGGSGYMIVPIFLSEISDDSVRGTLVSTLILMETAGILLAYIIGNYCDFYTIPMFAIALTTVFATTLYFLPESSLFLLKQQKINVITIILKVNL